MLFATLWNDFAEQDYDLSLNREHSEFLLVATPVSAASEKPYVNAGLAIATAFAAMVIGAVLFYDVNIITDPKLVWKGLPFAAAVMLIVSSHELAHYIIAKRREMKASLPFFLPLPFISPIGTIGALIRLKGAIPDRKSLFDVGIAGPLVALIATIVGTIIGLLLPPLLAGPSQVAAGAWGNSVLFALVRAVFLTDSSGVHPIAFAVWVGMLITSLNLLPVGQLDGGHIARALFEERMAYISAAVPHLLIAARFFYSLKGLNGEMLIFWGFFTLLFAAGEHPQPVNGTKTLDNKRVVLGIRLFVYASLILL